MTQADGSYCPIHRECGTMLQNLSETGSGESCCARVILCAIAIAAEGLGCLRSAKKRKLRLRGFPIDSRQPASGNQHPKREIGRTGWLP
jgi:hypothetical protein